MMDRDGSSSPSLSVGASDSEEQLSDSNRPAGNAEELKRRNSYALHTGPGADRTLALWHAVLATTVFDTGGVEKTIWDVGYKHKVLEDAAKTLNDKRLQDRDGSPLFGPKPMTAIAVGKAWKSVHQRLTKMLEEKPANDSSSASCSPAVAALVCKEGS